ncbi:HAMP domain-containing sensor histidine kinase [Cryobacterium sp. GrIS_2_6]|uniref:sensor histidine kinase n=1 Tax=Cryobacterium sp. GrIS_2_6 TaxID=3162785 RepID=UPI002DFCD71B|nr:signal transduction histidine kinase [Cryobacterium psychrotolerans]
MKRDTSEKKSLDGDALALRNASRKVGLQVTIACAVVVVVILVAIVLFIVSEVSLPVLLEPTADPTILDINAFKLLRASAVLGAGLIVLAGLLSWFVTRRAVKPLGDALRVQRSFVADASHELRTPLTILDARLQILQRGLPVGDPSTEVVAELRRDTETLIRVVNDLLESAEGAAGQEGQASDGSELGPAIEAAVASMDLIAARASVKIQVTQPAGIWTSLSQMNVQRCLVILLDNAIRYAPEGSSVTVDVTVERKTVTVTVRDRGPGIRGIEPSRIFDRFAHAGSAADGGSSGTGFGIGLSLVREIVVRKGGTVSVVSSSPTGTAIAFTMPVTRP